MSMYKYARTSRETPVGREPVCVEIFPLAQRLFQWRSATGCTRGMYVYTRHIRLLLSL